MKKLFFVMFSVFCLFVISIAQDRATKPVDTAKVETVTHDFNVVAETPADIPIPAGEIEQSVVQSMKDGFLAFINNVNWLFVVVFMLLSWLINDTAEATNFASWFSWWSKLPKLLRTLIVALAQMVVFIWLFDSTSKLEIRQMIFGILCGLIIYKIGIDKVFRWLSKRMGMKFES